MHTGDEAIAMLARGQHGIVTSAQLAEAGLGPRAVAHRVATGRLVRLHRGVFQVGPIAAPRGPQMAAVLLTGGLLSHHTAADLWGIRAHQGAIHVTVAGLAPRHDRAWQSIDPTPSMPPFTKACPSPPYTDTPRPGRHLPQPELDRAVEQAQILHLATRDEIEVICCGAASG